jgi:hypothetical protein
MTLKVESVVDPQHRNRIVYISFTLDDDFDSGETTLLADIQDIVKRPILCSEKFLEIAALFEKNENGLESLHN